MGINQSYISLRFLENFANITWKLAPKVRFIGSFEHGASCYYAPASLIRSLALCTMRQPRVNYTGTHIYIRVYTRSRTYIGTLRVQIRITLACLYSRSRLLNWCACHSIRTCDYLTDPCCVFATEMERHSLHPAIVYTYSETLNCPMSRKFYATCSVTSHSYNGAYIASHDQLRST